VVIFRSGWKHNCRTRCACRVSVIVVFVAPMALSVFQIPVGRRRSMWPMRLLCDDTDLGCEQRISLFADAAVSILALRLQAAASAALH